MYSKGHLNMTSNLPASGALVAGGSGLPDAPKNGNFSASVHAKVGDGRRSQVVVGLAGVEGQAEEAAG